MNRIEVWFNTGNGEIPKWCVSLCNIKGDEIELLSTFPDEQGAIDAGKAAAADRGLAVFKRERDGGFSRVV
jgi:hypothetical protein